MCILHIIQVHICILFIKVKVLFYELINEVLLWVCLRCKLFLYVAFYYYEKATWFLQRTSLISNFHLWSYWLESISDTWCYWFVCNLFYIIFIKVKVLFYELVNEALLWVCLRCKLFCMLLFIIWKGDAVSVENFFDL